MAGKTNQPFTSAEYRAKAREFASLFGFPEREIVELYSSLAMLVSYEMKIGREAAEESAWLLLEAVYTVNQDEPS